MIVYLDNSATTKVDKSVAEAMMNMLTGDYGNPSSMHRLGVVAEKHIKDARRIIAKALHCKDKEIYFTSGGTEANNIAIRGIAEANRKRGKHIITSAIEHPAVLKTMEALRNKGYEITVIPVDDKGVLQMEAFEKALSDQTILVSLMHVNNEVGSIQPIERVVKAARKVNKDIKIHVDAVQSFCKIPIHLKRLDIDALSISAHKFHGPKGVGALFLRDGTNIFPMATGGGQEKGIRPGTENVPGIVGMAEAVTQITPHLKAHHKHVSALKERTFNGISETLNNIKLNSGLDQHGSPFVLNISFKGIRGEVLLHALEDEGVFVSTGSACSSNQNKTYSHVLIAMGLDDACKEGAIRFSFSYQNTFEEIDYAVKCITEKVNELDQIIKGR